MNMHEVRGLDFVLAGKGKWKVILDPKFTSDIWTDIWKKHDLIAGKAGVKGYFQENSSESCPRISFYHRPIFTHEGYFVKIGANSP